MWVGEPDYFHLPRTGIQVDYSVIKGEAFERPANITTIIITPIIINTHLVWVLEGRSFERPHWEEEEVDPKDWDQDHHLDMFLIIILFLAASFCTIFG